MAAARLGRLPRLKFLLTSCDGLLNREHGKEGTSLIAAVRFNRPEVVQYLLELEANVTYISKHGRTALTEAVSRCDTDMIALLLRHGADPLTPTSRSALQIAVESGRLDIIEMLTEGRESINGNQELWTAYEAGRIDIMQHLLSKGCKLNTRQRDQPVNLAYHYSYVEYSNMMAAVVFGDIPLLRILLSLGCNVDECRSPAQTPLLEALEMEKEDIALFLIENGANISYTNKAGHNKALLTSIKAGMERATRQLIARGAGHMWDGDQNSPLFVAVQSGNSVLAEILLRAGSASGTRSYDHILLNAAIGRPDILEMMVREIRPGARDAGSALIVACKIGDPVCTEILLKYGADPNVIDFGNFTPLMWASYENHLSCAKILLQYKDVNVNWTDGARRSALHWATNKRHAGIVHVLLKAGADTELKNYQGNTALSLAVQNFYSSEPNCSIIEDLLDAHADCTAVMSSLYCVETILNRVRHSSSEKLKELFKKVHYSIYQPIYSSITECCF